MDKPYIILKWGTLKGWGNLTPEQVSALQKWQELGVSLSAMSSPNTTQHKEALCNAIDLFEDGQITNDWTDEKMSREDAKKYITEYLK